MPVSDNSPTLSEADNFGRVMGESELCEDIADPDSSSNDQGSPFSSDDEQDPEAEEEL